MHALLTITITLLAAFIVAGLFALLKLGSGEILRVVEEKWSAKGVILLIISWIVLLPIMMISSIVFGLYRLLTVKPHYV